MPGISTYTLSISQYFSLHPSQFAQFRGGGFPVCRGADESDSQPTHGRADQSPEPLLLGDALGLTHPVNKTAMTAAVEIDA